jgi:hypothetical protein
MIIDKMAVSDPRIPISTVEFLMTTGAFKKE